jgi:hypothetical protein
MLLIMGQLYQSMHEYANCIYLIDGSVAKLGLDPYYQANIIEMKEKGTFKKCPPPTPSHAHASTLPELPRRVRGKIGERAGALSLHHSSEF